MYKSIAHDHCAIDPTEYLKAYRLAYGTFYTLRMQFVNGLAYAKLAYPICATCGELMGPNSLKNYWPNEAEIENDFNGIASTCELLYESRAISARLNRELKEDIEKLKRDITQKTVHTSKEETKKPLSVPAGAEEDKKAVSAISLLPKASDEIKKRTSESETNVDEYLKEEKRPSQIANSKTIEYTVVGKMSAVSLEMEEKLKVLLV